MKIICKTTFDCTYTGVTGNFRAGQIPFVSKAGVEIQDHTGWLQARNQQRNWETLLQIISLNAQPDIFKYPEKIKDYWQFEFSVESNDVFGIDGSTDPLAKLKQNCNGVPMITGLTQSADPGEVLDPGNNIWFDTINTPLE